LKANHHTHSLYSDGNSQPEEYILQAIKLNFDILGFTEHSPLPFDNSFSFKSENKETYFRLMAGLKSQYAGRIKVYSGMEMDFIPGMSEDFASARKEYNLDYLIGSVHLVRPEHSGKLWFTDGPRQETYDEGVRTLFGGDIRKAVTTYYRQVNQMIETQDFEIIGHFDKIKMHNRGRFFSEDENWYKALVNETQHLIKEKGLIVEVNTRGIYKNRSETTFPGYNILKEISRKGIPVMINSDAHHPHELDGEFVTALTLLKAAGIREVVCFNHMEWESYPIEI
jgi:histidinol-phosphatase (PHP family)